MFHLGIPLHITYTQMFHLGITVRILFAWTSWCLRQLTTYLYQMRKMISSLTAKLTTTTDLSRKMGKRKEINLAAKAFSAFFVFFLFSYKHLKRYKITFLVILVICFLRRVWLFESNYI